MDPTRRLRRIGAALGLVAVDAIVKAEHAQLWINHDAKQSATIAHAPQFVQ